VLAVSVRPALGEEAATVAEIITRAFAEYVDGTGVTPEDQPSYSAFQSAEGILRMMEDGWTFLLAEVPEAEGAEPVGCIGYRTKGEKGEIARLAVAPESRGRGIGRLLMAHAECALVVEGAKTVELSTAVPLRHLDDYYSSMDYRCTEVYTADPFPFEIRRWEKQLAWSMGPSTDLEEFYDGTADSELARLSSTPYNRLEFEVTMHYLEKYLPPRGHVLDCGGGPGRYAAELAARGYKVTLTDISEEALALAERHLAEQGAAGNIVEIAKANAVDLSHYADASFDAMLLLGPLYHLPQEADRVRAIAEARRVLRAGAPLFAALLPRHAELRQALRLRPEWVLEQPEHVEEILQLGYVKDRGGDTLLLPDVYLTPPEEIRPRFEAQGFVTEVVAAVESVASGMDAQINSLGDRPGLRSRWLEILIRLSSDRNLLATSDHILYVGRRRAGP